MEQVVSRWAAGAYRYPSECREVLAPIVGAVRHSRRIVVAASGSYRGPGTILAHLLSVLGLLAQLEDRSLTSPIRLATVISSSL